MGSPRHSTATLALGLLISVAAHIAAGLALVTIPPSPAPPTPPDPPHDRPPLGIDRSRHVTLTWVGFEEPTPHQATESETEQSQETPHAGTPSRRPEPSPASAPADAQPAPSRHSEPADAAPRPVTPEQIAPEEPVPEATEPSESTPAARSDAGAPGIESDRETVATSVNDPMEIDPGEPAAREGLRLITRYIKWPETLIARPRNPVVEVWFGADGRPKDVRYARDPESGRVLDTGSDEVDEILRTEIYRWRGEGHAIDDLRGGDRLRVALRILM